MGLNIIGISALYHDSACCLTVDGVLKTAMQEERFTREKADASMPYHAMVHCLEMQNLSIDDIDCIAYYENPAKKLERQLWSGRTADAIGMAERMDATRPEREIREVLGYEGPVLYFDHHHSHAASSFFYSGFDSAASFTIDGVGEWATTTYGKGEGSKLEIFEEVVFPHSLGLLYSAITSYLGFKVNDGEYKVMGLAPYGKPNYLDQMYKLVTDGANGKYQLNLEYFDFISGESMYSQKLCSLFGAAPRMEKEKMGQFHADIAKSLQVVLENILLNKANYLYKQTGEKNLCMSGGVALNCVANGHILRHGPFERLFVQPAANDAGCALGAAALAYIDITGKRPDAKPLDHVYLGPSYGEKEIGQMLDATPFNFKRFDDTELLLSEVAERLKNGKVIGWFHGNMEFGPRSLGARSILADPRVTAMRDRINAMVKKREGFRPFAPAVLEEKAKEHFELDHSSPFMLETCLVSSGLSLPAITHVDGSARVQTVSKETNYRFASLIEAFDKITGCPILLNTSFNVKDEPIVCNPEDALRCFITTEIDCLVLENFIIDRENNELEFIAWLIRAQKNANKTEKTNLYTFI
jgi:carbamoyltransferase